MLSARQATVYGLYSYEILSVQLCRTVGAGLQHCWCQGAALFLALLFDVFKAMPNYQYIYAELSVYLCWTVGISMLDCWYQNAALFWYFC